MENEKTFKLLIVDDEIPAVHVVKCAVDWQAIGVSSVFAAYDVQQAKQAFENHQIDMMLCDIEMPQGNGLELLEWVRTHYPDTEAIIMTCHADFSYAKRALTLGSLEYLLKPIPPADLEMAVKKAMDQINSRTRLQSFEESGRLWLKHQPLLVERLWIDIIEQRIPPTEQEIRKAAEARSIPIEVAQKLFPVLIQVRSWHEEMSAEDEKLMEFALKNSAEDVLVKKDQYGLVADLGGGTLVCLLYVEKIEGFHLQPLVTDCEDYIAACNRYFCCDLCCYPGEVVYAHELPELIGQLKVRDRDNVSMNNACIDPYKNLDRIKQIEPPENTLWKKMLEEGAVDRLLEDVEAYLKGLMGVKGLDKSVLYRFQQDFMQMLHTYLNKKGILAHQLFEDADSTERITRAVRSIENMIAWVRHDVGKIVAILGTTSPKESVVEQAKQYIHLHIDQDLTCDELAKQYHFNPDYLTRLFKKEAGMTVSEYIANERLEIAKALLTKTDSSITSVALQAGYKSLSYFSTQFKKMTGKNPLDFRQEIGKTKMDDRVE